MSTAEIKALYDRPDLTPEKHFLYFSLSASEALALAELRTFESRVYFILQLGYFKAQHQFHIFTVQENARYVQERYFPLAEGQRAETYADAL